MDPEDPVVADLERIRVATTLGIGPRCLHSTGQLHKVGPDKGDFVQIVDQTLDDLPIPGERFGFASLELAQAVGDLQALLDRGLCAGRVHLEDLREAQI